MGLKTRGITVYRNRGYYISPPVMLRNTVTWCYITVMRRVYCQLIDVLASGAGRVTSESIGLSDRLVKGIELIHGATAAIKGGGSSITLYLQQPTPPNNK
jgi:hypothetical protein